jgi:hypothetical protein
MPDSIVLTPLARSRNGHGFAGYYCRCCKLFDIEITDVIAERGPRCKVVGMAPISCPRCGAPAEHRLTAPSKGSG